MYPKISIVTPSYNQGIYIEETILSIINQDYPNLEYIIIDGGSNDESVEIIKKYEKHLKHWMSEPDNGQADAINKGLLHCTGDIFNWINSDDLLAPNALNTISNLYKPGVTIAGRVFNFYQEHPELNDYTQNANLDFLNFLNFKSTYHQPGIWLDLQELKKIGKLDIDAHYYFDSIFYLTYFKKNKKIIYSDKVLAEFRVHNQSKTSVIQNKHRYETINFYKKISLIAEYENYRKNIIKLLDEMELNEYVRKNNFKNDSSLKHKKQLLFDIFKNYKFFYWKFYWKFIVKSFLK